jgi:hypothetical protein
MPQPYEFDPGGADGIRHADLDAGERVLNEIIYECQRSFEVIGHVRLDLEARSWATGNGVAGVKANRLRSLPLARWRITRSVVTSATRR